MKVVNLIMLGCDTLVVHKKGERNLATLVERAGVLVHLRKDEQRFCHDLNTPAPVYINTENYLLII